MDTSFLAMLTIDWIAQIGSSSHHYSKSYTIVGGYPGWG